MDVSGFFIIFSLSFMTALTGAFSPGPLMAYTIMRSLNDRKRGYLAGLTIISGHAILESAILAVIILGFSIFLQNQLFIRIVSLAGCAFLVYSGISIFVNAKRGTLQEEFLSASGAGPQRNEAGRKWTDNPVLGGIVVSMSNPYWWIWWGSIGGSFLAQYNITLASWDRLIAFFIGHEAGDLACYVPLSVGSHFGRKALNAKIYTILLVGCGVFMVVFGLYLGIKPFVV
jgi:threonine/homoserine/homoserine lactone efflux protein